MIRQQRTRRTGSTGKSGARRLPRGSRSALGLLAVALLVLTACGSGGSEDSGSSGASGAGASAGASGSSDGKSGELFGGGTHVFPDRRMVALYGAPGMPELGALGEQDPAASVARVKKLAKSYEPVSDKPVQPAFEIIATSASSQLGADGNYSDELSPEKLRPLIDEAMKNDVSVILDLQPGYSTFPEQAKRYEEFLKLPNVGLGIDPEWRLAPGQHHMEQIGSVSAQEINETLDWVSGLTREEDLPQKLVVIHQFTSSMITDRQDLDTSHENLALTIHADGHGNAHDKLETYDALQQDLPHGVYMSWKNFYDEDSPTWTPQQTYDLNPRPWMVTYQ